MFKRTLSHKASSLSMGKRHSRVLSSAAAAPAPAPARTLTMSASHSASNSACSSMVSEAPPHRRNTAFMPVSLEPTIEEPSGIGAEPLFDDSFLSSEPSDDYFESSVPKAPFQRFTPSLSIDTYMHKQLDMDDFEVDDESILSVDDKMAQLTTIYNGNDVATAVYIARPAVRPRVVDISPSTASRRSSMAPSEASARDYTVASHSRSSSYFVARTSNTYSRTSSISDSTSSDTDSATVTSPLTPPSTYESAQPDDGDYCHASVAKISHIRNLSASAPKQLREKVVAARSSEEQSRPSPPLSRKTSVRVSRSSINQRVPPVPARRISSVAATAV